MIVEPVRSLPTKDIEPELASVVHEAFFTVPEKEGSVIRSHSRSFSKASSWLPVDVREDVEKLYAWCRWCDEAVDSAPSVQVARARLECLRLDVLRIFNGQSVQHPASGWLADLVASKGIAKSDALALLTGMEMDLNPWQVQDKEELLRYCYHVAGVVGLMMCQVMGVQDTTAKKHAIDLGIAMQLTNIARDVADDWQRGRCYLPKDGFARQLLDETAVDRLDANAEPSATPSNERVRSSVEEILRIAESYYASGLAGLSYLPRACRPAICLAARMYREIGREILRQDCRVMDGRIKLSGARIAWVCCVTWKEGFIRSTKIVSSGGQPEERVFNFLLTSAFGDSKMNDARFLAYLGISLTCFMASALFVMVSFHPKDPSYAALPLVYAATCFVAGAVTNFLARRAARLSAICVPERV